MVAGFILLLGSQSGFAMGGFSCKAEDSSLKFSGGAGFGGAGGALYNFQSELEIYLPAAPKEFRKQKMNRSRVMHDWFDGKELKLALYRERSSKHFGSLELIVDAKRIDEGEFVGTYALTINYIESERDTEWKKVEAKGDVKCFTD
jgi:hypothetical protein